MIFVWAVIWAGLTAAAWGQDIIYPAPESASDSRSDHDIQLLQLVLAQSGKNYVLKPSRLRVNQARALAMLEQNQDMDVVWSMTSSERERRLLPVRIPIDKGLLGWRLLLIRNADMAKFSRMDANQIRTLVAGLGRDWPDVAVLRANGFRVFDNSDYESLFNLLAVGRFDYFPRAVTEIWPEVENHEALDLQVENRWLLHYPTAKYFFVHPKNTALAQDIRTGLERAIRDGSFERLFQQHYATAIRQSKLEQRQVIELGNPMLPETAPLRDARLWWRPPAAHRTQGAGPN